MKNKVDFTKIVFGELSENLQRLESVPLLRVTLDDAFKLGQLVIFMKEFIPRAFFMFVDAYVFKKPLPVPEAPIAHWVGIFRQHGRVKPHTVSGDYGVGWEYISLYVLEKLPRKLNPQKLLEFLVRRHQHLLKTVEKLKKKKFPKLCCIVLAPDWENVKELYAKAIKARKPSWVPAKKFIAEFRDCAKKEKIEVLTFKGFCNKYMKCIMSSDFKKEWAKYQRELYLDFMKRFPMIAYSLCHADYLAHKDYMNRAEVDLNDGKYPEAIAMYCKALEHVLRIYYFMIHKEEAPDKELGWFFQALKRHIKKEMGETYLYDLELVLARRPYAVHAKSIKKEPDELDAQEVSDRVGIFCKIFFYKKWELRI